MSRVALITGEAIVLHEDVATFPVPTTLLDGGDVTDWRHGDPEGYSDVDIDITADKATDTDGPLALYRVADGRVSFVALINNGQVISIQKVGGGVVVGFCQFLEDAGIADRFIVGGYGATVNPTVGGAVFTVRATPVVRS